MPAIFQISSPDLEIHWGLLAPTLIGRTHPAPMGISRSWGGLDTGSDSIGHCFLAYFF
jgi:hypothetical protein